MPDSSLYNKFVEGVFGAEGENREKAWNKLYMQHVFLIEYNLSLMESMRISNPEHPLAVGFDKLSLKQAKSISLGAALCI